MPQRASCHRNALQYGVGSPPLARTMRLRHRSGHIRGGQVMPGRTAKVKLTNSLIAAMSFCVVCWPVWTCAQPSPDVMAKTVKPDEMKWDSLGGGFEISILYTNPTT